MLTFKTVNIITVLLLIILLLGYVLNWNPLWLIFPIITIWLILTALGSGLIGWNYHFKSVNSNPNIKKHQVAITFDDGPNPEFTPQVLALLKSFHAKATFFCIGKNIDQHPDLFKTIIEDGHTVGNHTYSHSNTFGFFGFTKVLTELQETNQSIKKHGGLHCKLYRPAFGVTNPNIKKAVKALGLTSIGWNQRSFDTTNLSDVTILKRITKDLKKGDIILLHDSSAKTLRVLEQLLLFLQQQNLESVTIDSLCQLEAYA